MSKTEMFSYSDIIRELARCQSPEAEKAVIISAVATLSDEQWNQLRSIIGKIIDDIKMAAEREKD